jgi:hypothetical protein
LLSSPVDSPCHPAPFALHSDPALAQGRFDRKLTYLAGLERRVRCGEYFYGNNILKSKVEDVQIEFIHSRGLIKLYLLMDNKKSEKVTLFLLFIFTSASPLGLPALSAIYRCLMSGLKLLRKSHCKPAGYCIWKEKGKGCATPIRLVLISVEQIFE